MSDEELKDGENAEEKEEAGEDLDSEKAEESANEAPKEDSE